VKVVIDTNVLVSGIFYGGIPGEILEAWVGGRLTAYATPLIFVEYLVAIEDLGSKDPDLGRRWRRLLPKLCQVIDDLEAYPSLARDPTDDKFLSCAKRARAECLVTGDKDLKVLEGKFPFRIVDFTITLSTRAICSFLSADCFTSGGLCARSNITASV
jgi:putative PIN family toxin of toxin-antitoxin system